MRNKICIHFIEMNYVIIILSVVIILLLYYLYYYFTTSVNTLTTSVSLKSNQLYFGNGQLKNPSATHYAYGLWLFINTWSNNNTMSTVLQQNATASVGTGFAGPNVNSATLIFCRMDNSQMALYLDSSKPSLYYAIKDAAGTIQRQLITDNFPIQAWTQIIFSADNNIVDIYINGKLLLSNVYQGLAIPSADAGSTGNASKSVQLGEASVAFDANVTKFQQWSNMAVDPQTAWNSYMSGNGQALNLSSYNVKMQLLKDNVTQSQISAF
jgi:hypothetical protein